MFKRIIAFICTLAICFSLLIFPAFAEDYTSSAISFWDAFILDLKTAGNAISIGDLGLGDLGSWALAGISSDTHVCGHSDDGLHHADYLNSFSGKDEHGYYTTANCKYCGLTFKVYGSDLKQSADDYVKTNSGSDGGSFGVNSSGEYIVYFKCLGAIEDYYTSSNGYTTRPENAIGIYLGTKTVASNEIFKIVDYESTHIFKGSNYVYNYAYYPLFYFKAPFDFKVVRFGSGNTLNSCVLEWTNSLNGTFSRGNFKTSIQCYSNFGSGFSGQEFYFDVYHFDSSGSFANISGYTPIYRYDPALKPYAVITPLTSTTLPGSSTRPSTIIKNVYNISNNTTINNMFNETNNTYIDASTGDTYNVTNWEYNYGSRFYSFTYSDTDSVTHTVVITYADDFVTVTDNGTTSYYYYGFDDGGGSGGGGSSGGDSSGDSSGGGSGGGSSIDYTPVINDIIEKLQTLIEQGDANSDYLKKVMDALDSINSNTKDTYLTLLDLLNRVNTGLSYTDESGKTYSVSELAYYIYAYLKDNLDEKVSGISALLEKILKAIESISPNIDIDIDVDGDGQKDDTQTWFSGFLGKFAFVSTLYDCAKQLVADITNDAASAQAVNDGDIAVQDLTAEHAEQSASDGGGTITTYTSPEVLLNFPAVSWHGIDFSRMSALDLSWYAPYKPAVDNIVSGFLWLGFLWLLIKRAPGIIQGSAMAESDAIKIHFLVEVWKAK